jgi:hypothetical protein
MAIFEGLVVALIVTCCAVFSAWRLMSARLRLRLLDALAEAFGKAGVQLLTRLRQKTMAQVAGGCGACARATGTVSAISPRANRKPAAPLR